MRYQTPRKQCGQILLIAVASLFCIDGYTDVAYAAPRWEAYAGEPFGVGSVKLDVSRGEQALPLLDERFTVLEEAGRVFYPVVEEKAVRRLARRLLKIETPSSVTIFFLFRGDEPFDLSGFTPNEQAVRIKPQHDARQHQALLERWWKEYAGRWQRLMHDPQFPPVAENFLVASLARRLDKPLPKVAGRGILRVNEKKGTVWDELLANEAYRLKIDRRMVRDEDQQGDLQTVPKTPSWAELSFAENSLDEVTVEPLAQHVPEECFYLRFGSFTNYLWFRDLNAKWQGDLQNMISRRAIDRSASKRLQQQLSLRETVLAKIFGPQVIADVAIIGLDPYVQEGAAIGILFQAKNSQLLATDLTSKRREALQKFSEATETTVTIADREVSLIATPDGQVRSYYVAVDDFHFVTTSETLVERFLEASSGTRSLANLPSFRDARRKLPATRPDAVFAYISEKFFQNLCSPHYRIEVERRLESSRESNLLLLARYSASAEGLPVGSRDELIARAILPERFADRADGSSLQEEVEGSIDSLRGRPGFFLPVADVPVDQISSAEADAYRVLLEAVEKQFGQLPPIAVALVRLPLEEGNETLRVELSIGPLTGWKRPDWFRFLGLPNQESLRPVPGDLVALQAAINFPGGEPKKNTLNLFGGLRDFSDPLTVRGGKVSTEERTSEVVRGYFGIWPRPSEIALERMGLKKLLLEGDHAWKAKEDDFLLLSFKPEVVDEVLPHLERQPAERAAQVRIRVEDLNGKKITDSIQSRGYMQVLEASMAGSRMMNSLVSQLHLPPSEARALAERLVDGQFVCPLGGEYQLVEPQKGLLFWTSSAVPPENRFLLTEIPEDFRLPVLDWFRGLRAELLLEQDAISGHFEIDMTADAVP